MKADKAASTSSGQARSKTLIRPLLRKLHPYVPGEQPKIKGMIKLNTNENPYPPSRKVLRALKGAIDDRLRLYPNPTSEKLREELAKHHACRPENIIIGNGSDELLALAVRAFVEPADSPAARTNESRATVQYLSPCYSLYSVLAATHGAIINAVPLDNDFSLPKIPELRQGKKWDFNAALTFITTPNAPSGRGYTKADLERLCLSQKGVTILDEAYVDFAAEEASSLALKYPHVIISRTFSKAFSLCYLRLGYFIASEELVAALDKVRDSYNVNGLAQVAGLATLQDLKYYKAQFEKLIRTRFWLATELQRLGFFVYPSQTNFLFAKPPKFAAEDWLEKLRDRKILVRWFKAPEVKDYLRITVGNDKEAQALIRAAKAILASPK
ncbi:MAG: histidinol-phosphate transaminase [Verrucomicrobiales bacterium]